MLQRVSDEKIASSLEHERYVWCKDSFVSLLVVAVCWKEAQYLYYKAREQNVWLFHPPAEDCVLTLNLPNRMLIYQFFRLCYGYFYDVASYCQAYCVPKSETSVFSRKGSDIEFPE